MHRDTKSKSSNLEVFFRIGKCVFRYVSQYAPMIFYIKSNHMYRLNFVLANPDKFIETFQNKNVNLTLSRFNGEKYNPLVCFY